MIKALLIALMMMTVAVGVQAQVIDMRAYSRQRGFKAYQPRQMQSERRALARPSYAVAEEVNEEEAAEKSNAKSLAQMESEPKSIRQTGVKIFQKKDEGKVLNFKVDNPEFDNLSSERQKELMSRITVE